MQQQQQQQTGQQMPQPQFTFEGGHLVMYHTEATGLQAKDATVNDQDRMTDILNTEKHLTMEYDVAMNEASHDALYQVLKQNNDSCHQLERQLFNVMFKKGWYRLPVADAQSVASTLQKFQQYQSQFPFPNQTKQQQQQGQQASLQQSVSMQQQVTTPTQTATRNVQVSVKATPSQSQASVQAQTNAQAQTAGAQSTTAQTAQTATAQTAGASQADQQLNQKVSQAIRQAEQGQVPTVARQH